MAVQKVLIAGAGLGGLTVGACLLEAGVDVEIYEQADQLGEVGAGIQISANANRVLNRLGLTDRLVESGYVPEQYRFRLFDSGEILQTIPLGKAYWERHGVPYVTIHRADLHAILVDKVRSLKPDAIRLNSRVADFAEDDDGVTLHLADGRSARGDVLIGADGIKSAVRKRILGDTPPNYTGDSLWRVVAPMERLPKKFRSNGVDVWVGPGKHAVIYPLRGGTLMNMAAIVESDWGEDSWVARRPWEELVADFQGWHPGVGAVIQAADRDKCYLWAMNNRAPVDHWASRRAALLGDSAHATLPYMAQGAAMALEDGAVLTRALQQEGDISEALKLYQRNRVERTARVVNESTANRRLFHLSSADELRQEFAKRDMNAERTAWVFSYDAWNVELK